MVFVWDGAVLVWDGSLIVKDISISYFWWMVIVRDGSGCCVGWARGNIILHPRRSSLLVAANLR